MDGSVTPGFSRMSPPLVLRSSPDWAIGRSPQGTIVCYHTSERWPLWTFVLRTTRADTLGRSRVMRHEPSIHRGWGTTRWGRFLLGIGRPTRISHSLDWSSRGTGLESNSRRSGASKAPSLVWWSRAELGREPRVFVDGRGKNGRSVQPQKRICMLSAERSGPYRDTADGTRLGVARCTTLL